MAAKAKPEAPSEELVVAFTDAHSRTLWKKHCGDGRQAVTVGQEMLSRRESLRPGDMLHVTVPPAARGQAHEPRETD